LPAIYEFREFAAIGGLVSYAPDAADLYRQAGVYVTRILKGERPGELPVVQPVKFEFVLNLKTSKALGLSASPSLIARAASLAPFAVLNDGVASRRKFV
jgi:putative ABC transport system substrate-binding protein